MRPGLGIRRIGLLAMIGAVTTVCPAFATPSHAGRTGAYASSAFTGAGRPNFVVIMTDDQTVETLRVMPKLKRHVADKGVQFSNFVTSNPLCCPSRATFLTGQYSHNHGVFANGPPDGGYQRLGSPETTLPAALNASGYRTIHVGRYLTGYGEEDQREIPPGWTKWFTVAKGSQRYWGMVVNRNGRLRKYSTSDEDYSTDVFRRLAVKSIRKEADAPGPFFLVVSPLAVHNGSNIRVGATKKPRLPWPAPRDEGAFADEPFVKPPSYNEHDVSDKPPMISSQPPLSKSDKRMIRVRYRDRLETLLAVDRLVHGVMKTLARTGERDETFVFFTSDNGYFQGEHRKPKGKSLLYEPAIRVPFLVRGPGVARGVTAEAQVTNVDLAPTILELAGAVPLREPDGRSFASLLGDPDEPWLGEVLLESGGPSDDVFKRGIRTPEWKYVEWIDAETLAVEAIELYNLVDDPDELVNRAGAPGDATIQAALAGRLAELRSCAGASCHP